MMIHAGQRSYAFAVTAQSPVVEPPSPGAKTWRSSGHFAEGLCKLVLHIGVWPGLFKGGVSGFVAGFRKSFLPASYGFFGVLERGDVIPIFWASGSLAGFQWEVALARRSSRVSVVV